jgi:hypothetical protein
MNHLPTFMTALPLALGRLRRRRRVETAASAQIEPNVRDDAGEPWQWEKEFGALLFTATTFRLLGR